MSRFDAFTDYEISFGMETNFYQLDSVLPYLCVCAILLVFSFNFVVFIWFFISFGFLFSFGFFSLTKVTGYRFRPYSNITYSFLCMCVCVYLLITLNYNKVQRCCAFIIRREKHILRNVNNFRMILSISVVRIEEKNVFFFT